MAFFPQTIMPKRLKREDRDVDGNPAIFNARDYNMHHREILGIEELLIGQSSSLGTTGIPEAPEGAASAAAGTVNSVVGLIDLANDILGRISNGSLMFQAGGTISPGQQIAIQNAIQTTINGPLATTDTTIAVASTAGFTKRGYLTKINSMETEERCTDGAFPGAGSRCSIGSVKYLEYSDYVSATGPHRTNQEIIQYTGKTSTTFTGCTRSIGGSTAQAVGTGDSALLLAGRGAISIYPYFWGLAPSRKFSQVFASWDALLNVDAGILAPGSRQSISQSDLDLVILTWSLVLVGQFADVNIAQVFAS